MTDRLSQIKARHAEAGGGDGDLEWLIAEVVRERRHVLWVERRCWRTIPLLEAISHLEARIEAAEEERNAAVAEVERLRRAMPPVVVTYAAFAEDKQYGIYDTKALLARAERERRHGEWAMRSRASALLRLALCIVKGKALEAKVKRLSGPPAFLGEALNSGKGVYQP